MMKSFRLFDFQTKDALNENSKTMRFMVEMFGINETGETVSITVNDFQPFFYLLVDETWTDSNVETFLTNQIYGKMNGEISKLKKRYPLKAELCKYNKLYWFSGGNKNTFIKLSFDTMMTYYKVRSFWYSKEGKKNEIRYKNINVEIYETKIPPLLRFFHINKISPSGWIEIANTAIEVISNFTTTCTYEYVAKMRDILPQPDKETRVPYKIASFDIEASSSHGDFPLPIKTYRRLATQIVDIFNKRLASAINKSATTNEKKNDLLLEYKNILKRIIMTAFGYNIYENVDKVFPKGGKIQKDYLETLLYKFLEHPIVIDDSKKMLFQKNMLSNWLLSSAIADTKGDGDDNVGDGGDGGEDECAILDIVDEDDCGGYSNGRQSAPATVKTMKSVKKEENIVIIMDVITNTLFTREEKIKQLDESLMYIFPELEGDKTTFIGTTFCYFGEKEPYMNHCLVLGTCDEIDGVVVESVNDEKTLLLNWTRLIQEENPDIIIGYNIFGFDYEFLYRRSCENECQEEFLELSRKIGEVCAKFSGYDIESREITGIETTKVLLASGEYDLRYIKMSGRVQIDMYAYLRRDYNLSSYKLDDVAGQFICDDIKNIEYVENGTKIKSSNLTGIHKHDYIHIEIVGVTTNYIENGKKFHIVEICNDGFIIEGQLNIEWIEAIHNKTKNIKLKWGIAKDDVSPQDIFRLTNGTASDRAKVAKYCIQDCNLVHHLINKIDAITGYIEMSNICSVPISFLVFRGQGIKLTSYVAKKCSEKNTLIPDLDSSFGNDEGYEGAIVLPPKCSMYMDNPVACVDYASLYPSSMISNNLSPDSKIWTQEYDLNDNLIKELKGGIDTLPEGYDFVDVEFDTFQWKRKTASSRAVKVKTGKKICRFAQFPDEKLAILPSILKELLKARADTRKRIKSESDAFMRNVLDKRQLAYKVTANSLYGQCGSKTSTFFEKDVAAATTATGRKMIIYAKRIIEEVYSNMEYNTKNHGVVCCNAEYVYGDSVAYYTPIYINYNGKTTIFQIDELCFMYGDTLEWVQCNERGKEEKEVCNFQNKHILTWSDKGWTRLYRIIRHKLSPQKKMFRILTPKGVVDVTDDHSLLNGNGVEISPKECVIGTELLHNDVPPFYHHLQKAPIVYHSTQRSVERTDQTSIAYVYWLCKLRGWKVSIDVDKTNLHYYKVTIYSHGNMDAPETNNKIREIYEIDYPKGEYVYDLTTENSHFSAGIGEIVVHNTDSVFFTFNLQNKKGQMIRGKDALEITIEIAQDVAKLCTRYLKPPMELTYEKTLMPFILLSKKRYVGMLYEEEATGDGKLKYMGLSIKRRDSCDYLKEIYGRVLNILMKEKNVIMAVEFLQDALKRLVEGNVSLDKLIITKALRSDYKNPDAIAHRVLADRIAERDPGNKPKSGDRIKYLFVQSPTTPPKGKSVLMGDRVETPEFVIAGKAKIDYIYYITNQLMNPMTQLFGLALEQIYMSQNKRGGGSSASLIEYSKMVRQLKLQFGDDMETFNKQKEKYCSKQIERLIFNDILLSITQQKNNQRSIMGFLQK